LRPSGLATTQYALLVTLARAEGPLRHHQLAEAQVMDGTTLTRNLAPLARDGLVQIAPGTDRRTRFVSLTPAGVAALERARPLWRAVQERIVTETGDERIATLLHDLADLVTRIR
jgi:DNA-binding MarR family transcriptional regulator